MTRTFLFALPIAGLLAAGCQNSMYDENLELHRQNRELQNAKDVDDARLRNMVDPAQVQALQSQIAQKDQEISDRDAKITDLQGQLARQPATPATAGPNIAGMETTYNTAAGTMTVNLPGDVLFESGKADLKSSASATLDKIIAAIKKDYAGKRLYVDGYTDSNPISKTADKWEDNLDLSAARARAVADYLTQHGLDQSKVAPRAFGATASKGSKAKSRRVEIVVQVK